jgi:hypothetical protein
MNSTSQGDPDNGSSRAALPIKSRLTDYPSRLAVYLTLNWFFFFRTVQARYRTFKLQLVPQLIRTSSTSQTPALRILSDTDTRTPLERRFIVEPLLTVCELQ